MLSNNFILAEKLIARTAARKLAHLLGKKALEIISEKIDEGIKRVNSELKVNSFWEINFHPQRQKDFCIWG